MYIILQLLVLVNDSSKEYWHSFRIELNTCNIDRTQTFVVGWMVGRIFDLILCFDYCFYLFVHLKDCIFLH